MSCDADDTLDTSHEGDDVSGRSWMATVVVVLVFAATACTTPQTRPVEFDHMTTDEVGCTVQYGDAEAYVIGPLGPSDFEVVAPNEFTSFRVARTALAIVTVAELSRNASTPLNDIPSDGIVLRGPFIDGGNLGYVITCWRGTG